MHENRLHWVLQFHLDLVIWPNVEVKGAFETQSAAKIISSWNKNHGITSHWCCHESLKWCIFGSTKVNADIFLSVAASLRSSVSCFTWYLIRWLADWQCHRRALGGKKNFLLFLKCGYCWTCAFPVKIFNAQAYLSCIKYAQNQSQLWPLNCCMIFPSCFPVTLNNYTVSLQVIVYSSSKVKQLFKTMHGIYGCSSFN